MSEERFKELLENAKELKIEDLQLIQDFITHEHLLVQEYETRMKELIGEFNAIRDRIILQMKERYGNTAKGNEYLENLFKEEFKKWE